MLGEINGVEGKLSEDCGITPRIFEYLFSRIRTVCLHKFPVYIIIRLLTVFDISCQFLFWLVWNFIEIYMFRKKKIGGMRG